VSSLGLEISGWANVSPGGGFRRLCHVEATTVVAEGARRVKAAEDQLRRAVGRENGLVARRRRLTLVWLSPQKSLAWGSRVCRIVAFEHVGLCPR
jgi:hypothetical protein